MKVICRARAAGKTHDLIMNHFLKSAKEPEYDLPPILVVMSEQEKHRIIETYKIASEDQKRIISWANVPQKIAGTKNPIIIDNADILLEMMFRRTIDAITLTGETL